MWKEERKKVKGHQVRVHSLIKYGLLSNCPQLRSDEHASAFSVTVFGYKGGWGVKGNVVVNGGAMHLNCATSAQEDHPPHLTLMCFSPISVINNVVLDGIEAI